MLTPTSVLLNELLATAGFSAAVPLLSLRKICFDSRQVEAGDLFVAIPCVNVRHHIKEALAKGAVAIVAQHDICRDLSGVAIPHDNPRLALALLARAYYSLQPTVNVAVTGTNGKSSVVSFTKQFWQANGYAAAATGTLGLDVGTTSGMLAALKMPCLTTPDPVSLHQALHLFASNGVTHCAFEASSHGLDQYRMHGVTLEAAAWTNLTQDHLDYHPSMEAYFTAKRRLFEEVLPAGKIAVVNKKTAYFDALAHCIQARHQELVTYGVEETAYLEARNLSLFSTQTSFDLWVDGKSQGRQTLNMAGAFQVENVLCAMGLALRTGVSLGQLLPMLPQLKSALGRMELIKPIAQGPAVFVDYAHTPDALKRALQSLRQHTQGSLWVVFGCGGDRDRDKRPLMGSVAKDFADCIVVTDDNPRTEDPQAIRQEILKACTTAIEIGDRRQAIHYAIEHLQPHDVLLVAGKGHEQGQILKDQVYPFDDRQEIAMILGAYT